MTKQGSTLNVVIKSCVLMVFFLALGGAIVFYTGVLQGASSSEGLSGLVSVKGTVKVADLGLSKGEVKKINRMINKHEDTFSRFNFYLDTTGEPGRINANTELIVAVVLETDGQCEVRSWSKKIYRNNLVPQMVTYIKKAAAEYEKFKQFPDVKQNFKCLYI